MTGNTTMLGTTPTKPLTLEEKLTLAQRLFKEYHIQCFWHMKPDAIITEGLLPSIIDALRLRGGKRGALQAEKLVR